MVNQLPRRERRRLARITKMPWNMFREPVPTTRYIRDGWYWQGKDYPVFFHLYTHCPTLFREWAGGSSNLKPIAYTKAARILKGMCGACWVRWNESER